MKKTAIFMLILVLLLSGCSGNKSETQAPADTVLSSDQAVNTATDATTPTDDSAEVKESLYFCNQKIDENSEVYLFSNVKDDYYGELQLIVEMEDKTHSISIGTYEKQFFTTSNILVDDFNQDDEPDFLVWCLISPNGGTVCQLYTFNGEQLELICDLNEMELGISATAQENYMLFIENVSQTERIEINLAEQMDPSENPGLYDEQGRYTKQINLFYRSIEDCFVTYTQNNLPVINCQRIVEYGAATRISYLLQYDAQTGAFVVGDLKVVE